MNKLLATLALVAMLSLASCGKAPEATTEEVAAPVAGEETTATPTEEVAAPAEEAAATPAEEVAAPAADATAPVAEEAPAPVEAPVEATAPAAE